MSKRKKSVTYYTPTTDAIEPADHIDSRDVIARIEDLEQADDENPLSPDDAAELKALKELAAECEGCADWEHGETLICESAFTDYIKELIHDCYELPKEMDSGKWPYCHMAFDYEAAADDAKQDYTEVSFPGHGTYLIRS